MLSSIIILDYCGGESTDLLYNKLKSWNQNYQIDVLDNASPSNKSKCITYQNKNNSFIGGGIKDCINLAVSRGSKYLIFITNDVVLHEKIKLDHLENLMESDNDLVQISLSLSSESDKAYYPWMIHQRNNEILRFVHHADFIFSIFRLPFIQKHIEFPVSKSGWGYDWEFAYVARKLNKKIAVLDKYFVSHYGNGSDDNWKIRELEAVFSKKYGDYRKISPHEIRLSENQVQYVINKCRRLRPFIFVVKNNHHLSQLTNILEHKIYLGSEFRIIEKINLRLIQGISPGKMTARTIPDNLFVEIILNHLNQYFFEPTSFESSTNEVWGWLDINNYRTLNVWTNFFPNAMIISVGNFTHKEIRRFKSSISEKNEFIHTEHIDNLEIIKILKKNGTKKSLDSGTYS